MPSCIRSRGYFRSIKSCFSSSILFISRSFSDTMVLILLAKQYGILFFMCLGWQEVYRRYCLLSVFLKKVSVSIFLSFFLIIISRNGNAVSLYSMVNFKGGWT